MCLYSFFLFIFLHHPRWRSEIEDLAWGGGTPYPTFKSSRQPCTHKSNLYARVLEAAAAEVQCRVEVVKVKSRLALFLT